MSFAIDQSLQKTAPDDSGLARRYIEQAHLALEEQMAARHSVLTFGDEHPDWLYRSCLAGHLTSSALIVNPDFNKVLLIHHKKLDLWLQPGGHADGDGNLANVALKEVEEETGLSDLSLILPAFDLDVHTIPAHGSDPEHLHLDLRFVVIAHTPDAVMTNHEIISAAWVGLNDPRLKEGDLFERAELSCDIARGVV